MSIRDLRKRFGAALLLVLTGVATLDQMRCLPLHNQACRFVETYRNTSEVGFIGRLALSLAQARNQS